MSKIKDEVRARIEAWDYFSELPQELEGFTLTINKDIVDGIYRLFTYRDDAVHRSFFIVYQASLGEFHVQESIGLHLFCQIEYITGDLTELKKMLIDGMRNSLQKLRRFPNEELGCIFRDKGILTWDYIPKLPEKVLGFDLFIRPTEAIRIINGSFLFLDYTDFRTERNLVLYYNIYRDEFFGELRIRKMPRLITEFDSCDIKELTAKMEENFLPMLELVQAEAAKEEA